MRSWIDHVVCTNSFSLLVSDVYRVQLGSNLSDHYPLGFIVQVDCVTIPVLNLALLHTLITLTGQKLPLMMLKIIAI